jgi:hypothetical protein
MCIAAQIDAQVFMRGESISMLSAVSKVHGSMYSGYPSLERSPLFCAVATGFRVAGDLERET